MKKFIYKGFGLNGQETISFEIVADNNAKVYCKIYSSDQKIIKEKSPHDSKHEDIFIDSEVLFKNNYFVREDIREEGKEKIYETLFDDMKEEDWTFLENFSKDTPIYFFHPVHYAQEGTIEEVISFIKKMVKDRKEYWQNRRSALKKVNQEIMKVTPEQMMIDGNEKIITIYEVIKK